ncbi:hypothetical protein BRO54_1795 [Geobacillus proteiniphilus]|uniref:Uncharacterized protein n=1 Tax=Geobacillus proteiniphilus TaxID=860353 RepID=A0A1Q5T1C1_9BACL|nr:hypothetical protein BRO54_1795 [Geobacillus proteiniphilus]
MAGSAQNNTIRSRKTKKGKTISHSNSRFLPNLLIVIIAVF